MATNDVQLCSGEDDRELRDEKHDTPALFAFDCGQLPFERMGNAHFELLLADLYAARAADGSEGWYDKARRLNDGADQGRDVILFDDGSPVGGIQCKRYNGIFSLPMVIQEICKFFLYATIKPGIASAPGEPFCYYVAVFDRATGKLFEFMDGSGRQRFVDLRAEFEEKAVAARKASATLRKHAALKDLTQQQLCDLIWARIDNLHTALHKKDDLSPMVGAYPCMIARRAIRLSIARFSHILLLVLRAIHAMTGQILTLKEVAVYLKLAEKTTYKLAAEGKLPGFKVGGSWRFKETDIERWIEEKKSKEANK